MSETVTKHKVATITYVIKGEDGSTIEQNDVPVEYVHGTGSDLLPALELAIDGHKVGDIVTVTIPPDEAFGDYEPDLTFTDSIDNVPEDFRHVGAKAEFTNEQGEVKTFVVTSIDNDEVILDGNHPLAGETIRFDVTIHAIRDASEQEIANKEPSQVGALDIIEPVSGTQH